MTVANITPRITYSVAGTEYTFTFQFQENTDIKVETVDPDGVVTTKNEGTDYTLVNSNPGGVITFITALTAGDLVAIYRDTVLSQPVNLPTDGRVATTLLEDMTDRIALQMQEVADINERALKYPKYLDHGALDLPLAITDKVLGWNAAGDIVNLQSDKAASTEAVAAALAAAQSASDAAQSAISLTSRYIFPEAYGAVGNGIVDDTAAIQAAFDAAATLAGESGISVSLSSARYRITAALKMRAHVPVSGSAEILLDYDGPAFVGGNSLGTEGTYLYIEGITISGVTPSSRPNQCGIKWVSVYANSFIRDLVILNMGGKGIYIESCNAIKLDNNWVNLVRGNSCLYLKNSSAIVVVGGAYEGPAYDGTNYGATGKSIHIDNSSYGDWSPRFYGVQTERSAYGIYATYVSGMTVAGLTSHFNASEFTDVRVAQVYLSATTNSNILTDLFGGDYAGGSSFYIKDMARSLDINPSSGSALPMYVQDQIRIGGSLEMKGKSCVYTRRLGNKPGNTAHTSFIGGMQIDEVNLADDACYTFTLKAGSSARATYILVNNDRAFGHAMFTANSTDVPTNMVNSGNVSYGNSALTDGSSDGVDENVNIFPVAGAIAIKNRLGFQTRFTLFIFSSTADA